MDGDGSATALSHPMTPALLLIEKWARHRGDGTMRGTGVFGTGRTERIVRIVHGSAPIYVRDLGKCLMVLGVFILPPPVREALRSVPLTERIRFVGELNEVLMSCPRLGFGLASDPTPDPAEMPSVILEQTFQAAENDSASFNRFCDAIQETETILLRANAFAHRFVSAPIGAPSYSSNTAAPSELYL